MGGLPAAKQSLFTLTLNVVSRQTGRRTRDVLDGGSQPRSTIESASESSGGGYGTM